MKYTLAEKAKRNRRLAAFKVAHPEMTLRAIGKVFHLSTERVRIILKGFDK